MAFGFRPTRYLDGKAWNGTVMRCVALASYNTAIFPGDLVALVAGGGDQAGGTDPNTGAVLPTVEIAAAGARILGAVVSVEPNRGDLSLPYRAASTERQLMVAVASHGLIFEATADAACAIADIGQTYDHNATAGSTTTGYSGHDIDIGTAGTGSGGLQLVGIKNDPDNLNTLTSGSGTTATVWQVVIAEPQVAATQVGAGI